MSQTQTQTQTEIKLQMKIDGQVAPQLYVNDGPLATEETGFLRPTDPIITSMETMRQRYQEDGYLFLKGLIPREDVLEARRHYFDSLSPTGLLKPGSSLVDGVFNPAKDRANYHGIGAGGHSIGSDEAERYQDLALKAHAEPWYKDVFCKHPVLLDFVKRFSGWGDDTLAVQRTLLRNNIPGNRAIGVHYDLIFLRYNHPSVLTAWVPMGDIKLDGGGLIYLERGHKLGEEIEQEFTEKAKTSGLTEDEAHDAFNRNMMTTGFLTDGPKEFAQLHKRRWLVTGYEAGDCVLHDAYSIHASTINRDPERVIRLGTDLRFVDSSKPWDERWNKVFEIDDGL